MNTSLTQKNNSKKGFTLVETLVAITILLLAISATLFAASAGLSSSIYSREQITAFYLAQDAIEYVKNIRDNVVLVPIVNSTVDPITNWTTFRSNIINKCSGGCGVDTTITGSSDVLEGLYHCDGSCILYQNEDSHLYGANSLWSETGFSREVTISQSGDNNSDEIKVSVNLSWTKGEITKSFTVTEFLFNWQ